MAHDDYIPSPHTEFFEWENILVSGVATNEVAWGLLHPKVLELQGKHTVYNALYTTAHTPATKTKAANVAHEEGRNGYEKYIRGFVKEYLINNSAISTEEKINLGLNPQVSTGGSRPAIQTAPHTTMKSLGGGWMKFENRVEGDESRPSRHTDSDGLEIRYAITPYKGTGTTPPPVPPVPPPSSEPADTSGSLPTPEQCPLQHFSTKAGFKLQLGAANIGKLLLVYSRWKNNTDDAKSGPFPSLPVIILIS